MKDSAFLTAIVLSLAVIILAIMITGLQRIPVHEVATSGGVPTYQGAFPPPAKK